MTSRENQQHMTVNFIMTWMRVDIAKGVGAVPSLPQFAATFGKEDENKTKALP